MPSIAGLVGPAALANGIKQSLLLARGANPTRDAKAVSFDQHLEKELRPHAPPNALVDPVGLDNVSIDTVRVEHQTATAEFEMQFRRLLQEQGIDVGKGIELSVNRQGDVEVAGDHPQKQAIEALFHENPELRQLFIRLDGQASLLRAADFSATLARLQAEAPDEAAAQVQQLLGTPTPSFSLVVGPQQLAVQFS